MSASRVWSNLPLRWKGLAVIAVPLLPLGLIAVLVFYAAGHQRDAQAAVARTLIIKNEISALAGHVADADSGIRGYLLTRGADQLKLAEDARSELARRSQTLGTLITDHTQRQHLLRLAGQTRQLPLTPLLELGDAPGAGAPAPETLLANSAAVVTQVRAELAAMHRIADDLLGIRVAAAHRAETILLTLSLTGVGLGAVAALGAVLAFTHGLTKRIDALRRDAVRLAAGEPLTTVAVASRDEVGQLTNAIVDASSLLQQRDHELQRRVREVEDARSEINQFFDVSLDLLCIVGVDGRFHRVNRAWEAVLGWRVDELLSMPALSLVHSDDLAAAKAEAGRLARGLTTADLENRYRCKDGTYRWLSWKATGDLERGVVYAAARDVTQEKQWAREQTERVGELAALNHQLESFSYSVSHDLRAPLRHMVGFTTLLEQRANGSLDAQCARYLTTIKDAAGRMGRLIDDLLAFSRTGRAPLNKRRVDLVALVDDVKNELEAETKGRTVRWEIAPLPEVEADPALIRMVIVNLLDNALKYTGTTARARIEVGAIESTSGETVFFVRDNGVGFDMAYVDKLFGVFQRLHSADEFDGTGIGLATVHRIVHRHGGRVWAEGSEGRGATFFFTLPTTESESLRGEYACTRSFSPKTAPTTPS